MKQVKIQTSQSINYITNKTDMIQEQHNALQHNLHR